MATLDSKIPKGPLKDKWTTYKDKITLNSVAYDEPWLEVQTKDGKYKGWIYAGGVRAYQAD